MKYLILALAFMATTAVADQRFETVGGFCHFVTPEGFNNANDDNEVFFANCENSIRQKNNGDGEGSTVVTVKYPGSTLPFYGDFKFTGADTGVNCVMVDSNGTQYTTQDWTATYEVEVKDLDKFKKAFATQEGDKKYNSDYDFNEDGVINALDIGLFREQAKGKIEYVLSCRNAPQQ